MMYGMRLATHAVYTQTQLKLLKLPAKPDSSITDLLQFLTLPLPLTGSEACLSSLHLAEVLASDIFYQWALVLSDNDSGDSSLNKKRSTLKLRYMKNFA